jgi:hypothetical protein
MAVSLTQPTKLLIKPLSTVLSVPPPSPFQIKKTFGSIGIAINKKWHGRIYTRETNSSFQNGLGGGTDKTIKTTHPVCFVGCVSCPSEKETEWGTV